MGYGLWVVVIVIVIVIVIVVVDELCRCSFYLVVRSTRSTHSTTIVNTPAPQQQPMMMQQQPMVMQQQPMVMQQQPMVMQAPMQIQQPTMPVVPQVQCYGCQTLLAYTPDAGNTVQVACYNCATVNEIPGAKAI
jgi:LSD1 subclass zinc finger protein